MKIKKLEWSKEHGLDKLHSFSYITANSPIGEYRVEWFTGCIFYVESSHHLIGETCSLEDAKKIAQEHFENIVKECIEE